MLTEHEIKMIIKMQKEQQESIKDSFERKICGAFIAGLECALNE